MSRRSILTDYLMIVRVVYFTARETAVQVKGKTHDGVENAVIPETGAGEFGQIEVDRP